MAAPAVHPRVGERFGTTAHRSFVLRPGATRRAVRHGPELWIEGLHEPLGFRLSRTQDGDAAALAPLAPLTEGADAAQAVFAAFELVFAAERGPAALHLEGSGWDALLPRLLNDGLAVRNENGKADALAAMVWQVGDGWMAGTGSGAYPAHPCETNGRVHPRRPPAPTGALYARFVPWLGGVLSFEAATMNDLPILHRWLNDPHVDRFWHEAGSLARHTRYLENQLADPHTMPIIGRFEGEEFGYFEVYWAAESLIGPFYDAAPYDRGWHVLVGEERFRGRPWISAWLPSLMHMLFLDDPRTLRIVGEPQADHHRQIRNLRRSGFEVFDTVDLPAKRAALVSLSHARFFGERLWRPAVPDVAAAT